MEQLDGVPFVSTMLEDMVSKVEMYGKRRLFPDRARGDHRFSAVIQYFCRRSSWVSGKKHCPGGPVQLFVKKHLARHGCQVTRKGHHNHDPIPISERPRWYDSLLSLMRGDETRYDSANDESGFDRAFQGCPVRGSADGGRPDAGDDETERGEMVEGGVVGAVLELDGDRDFDEQVEEDGNVGSE